MSRVDGLDSVDERCVAAQRELDPSAGVMVRVVWFDAGPGTSGRLFAVMHHLVVDGVSWRILLPDLVAAWQAVAAGQEPVLEPVGTSFRVWSEQLRRFAESPEIAAQLPLWQDMVRDPDPLLGKRAIDPAVDLMSTSHSLSLTLPVDVTDALLTEVVPAFHGRVNDVLLTGLALVVADWRGYPAPLLVDLEGHGREDVFPGVDVSRTVGWFTTLFPVRLELGGVDVTDALQAGPAAGLAIKRVKEQLRVPHNGLGYGLVRDLLEEGAVPQIGFNYLGRFSADGIATGGEWRPAFDGPAGNANADMPLRHALEINSSTLTTADGPELTTTWTWPAGVLSDGDVHALALGWFAALRALVDHTRRPDAGGLTPSDLPLVSLPQHQLDALESSWRKQ